MDGSNLTQLTFNGADHQPTWMPAGNRVVFANNDGLDHGIFSVNVDGSDRATMHSCGPVGNCRAPMVSPDGTRLTFWTPLLEGQIVILTFSNQGWVELAHLGSGTEYPATFSPDGTKLVFTAGPYGTDIDLYSVNAADGSGLTRLTSVSGPDAAPSWHR
jgi:Tol biopolymer transport system component